MSRSRSPGSTHVVFGGDRGAAPSDTDALRLGGKAAGLITMSALGLPVPPGVVLPVGVSEDRLDEAARVALLELERITDRRLGDPDRPLLVSVRSGAAVSMPGMLDTLLDVGATPDVTAGLARATGDEPFAEDTRRRLLEGWADVVGGEPPDDPVEQVVEAAHAVRRSWNGQRARAFRAVEGIDESLGASVTIQSMVFGNLGRDSGSGVAFSRDPSTGAAGMVGDLLVGAQGVDVVGGGRTTSPLSELGQRWPSVQDELAAAVRLLEQHHADMVDVEFTVERGRLFLLQCRPGRRSAAAAARIAVEMAEDPSIPLDRAAAVARCRNLLSDGPDPPVPPPVDAEGRELDGEVGGREVVARGLAASPGRGTGVLVVSVDEALRRHEAGEAVVLARPETSPADVAAMAIASGIVTTTGGIVSHAAVVARSWGLPAVVGATDVEISERGVTVRERTIAVGESVTVDGDVGVLLAGAQPGGGVAGSAELELLRRWASELDEL